MKKFRRSAKNIETGRKISHPAQKKGRKNYSDEAKKSQKTDDPDKKAADFFAGGRKKAEKDSGKGGKSAGASEKKHENIQMKRKNAYPKE